MWKISIENCLELDENNEKCSTCIGDILPDANGRCNLPSPLIKGCSSYNINGKCLDCDKDGGYELTSDGTCKFNGCEEGYSKLEYCAICKPGYHQNKYGYTCYGYDGSVDVSSDSIEYDGSLDLLSDYIKYSGNLDISSDISDFSLKNKVEYGLLIFILTLLV